MGQSWSRVVDDLVRNGSAATLQWEGLTLRTHFQPVHGVLRAECAGYEALLRATDAGGRILNPRDLFARARRDGRLVVLDRACRALHLRNFAIVDPGAGRLFLNVEPDAAIADATTVREFGDLIRYYGLTPKRVCLEILETGCASEAELGEAVEAYREIGSGIAMDDFGVGCSNFDRLAALRPNLVKIERSVLSAAVGDGKSRGMLPPMVEVLREAGAKVVIERVESAQEAMLAIDSGANYLQGNYLASPAAAIPSDDFTVQVVRKLRSIRRAAPAASAPIGD